MKRYRLTLVILIAAIIIFIHSPNSNSESLEDSKSKALKMKLTVLSDYGAKENLISKDADQEIIIKTMGSLDWNGFHQVILETDDGSFLEVGGSLDPSDGLSAMYAEKGEQHFKKKPPASVKEMTDILLLYLKRDAGCKNKNTWE